MRTMAFGAAGDLQRLGQQRVRLREARVVVDGRLERRHGARVVAARLEVARLQEVALAGVRRELDAARGGGQQALARQLVRAPLVEHVVVGAEAHAVVREDQRRLAPHRQREVLARLRRRRVVAPRGQLHGAMRQLPGLEVLRPRRLAEAHLHARHHHRIGGRDDGRAHRVLHLEELALGEVEALGPEAVAALPVDDLDRDAPAALAHAQRAVDQEARAQRLRHGLAGGAQRARPGARGLGDDREPARAREEPGQVVGDGRGDGARARLVVERAQRQDGDGRPLEHRRDARRLGHRGVVDARRLGAVADLERRQDGREVHAHGARRDRQRAADVVVGEALGDELEDLALPRRQGLDALL
ncbi:MAG: hypothetical protein U1F43_08635 [Myxococcota bacterium]